MALLTDKDGELFFDNVRLDALLVTVNISSSMKFDEPSEDSMSGSIKRPIGFNDAEILYELELLTDEDKSCYDRLKSVNKIFKAVKNGNVKIYNLNNKHLEARGIRNVLFTELTSSEENESDIIKVVLRFKEYEQPTIRQERTKGVSKKDAKTSITMPKNITPNRQPPEMRFKLSPKDLGIKR